MTMSWRETIEDAKDTLRRNYADEDSHESAYEVASESISDIADDAVPTYNWEILELLADANLMGAEPENMPERASAVKVARIVLYEAIEEKLWDYLTELEDEFSACVPGEHLVDRSSDETYECHICGDEYCAQHDHGHNCPKCGEPTCSTCLNSEGHTDEQCDNCKLSEDDEGENDGEEE